jgi:hypothetical protein
LFKIVLVTDSQNIAVVVCFYSRMHLYDNVEYVLQIELERTNEDIQMDEIRQYMLLLERHMGKVAKQSELLVRSSRESAKAMHELGQGLQGT